MTESITTTPRRGGTPARPPRLLALDVLRGIAILGTLGTNIWILTDPHGLPGYLTSLGAPATDAAMWTERVLQQLAQGKFLGLLTVMFGIGLAIQQSSAARAGRGWPGTYPIRAALLLLDGVLNFLLIAEFDVLTGYAVTGLIVAYVLARSDGVRRRVLVIAASVHLAMLTLVAVALVAASSSSEPERAELDPNPYADGSFWDLVVFRWENAGLFRAETLFVLPMSIALFLLGARLFRAGVFEERGARLRRRLLVLGFGVAAPVDLAVGILGGGDLILFTRYGSAPFVALGILALVAGFYLRRPRVGWVGARLGEVGRMALSCYILQNLVASALCYGWGLGSAARVGPEARVPFTVGVYLVVVCVVVGFAHLWSRRFERGPVEWLWQRGHGVLARATRNSPRDEKHE
ncbi:DUF418 domain-containing protein [Nocardia bovistercoris]|uniref:DUF418 domain-containing protein n=1 Tax=Nocardia bovistercoris TaxID=2785916 RepID=A0A931IHF2_9NOCA|nr:DUF418 domain-containing protein [Nocardia bovistercoris]MBH0779688.1 DUF418 domain-containing protein [Nocardia bovistercoris]